ncbi:MAG: hypothetical protein U0869_25890 [Chloroflexota bacterium]
MRTRSEVEAAVAGSVVALVLLWAWALTAPATGLADPATTGGAIGVSLLLLLGGLLGGGLGWIVGVERRRPRRPRFSLRWDPALGTANLSLLLLFMATATRWGAWAETVGSLPVALAITLTGAMAIWALVFAGVRLGIRLFGRRARAGGEVAGDQPRG